MDKKNLLHTERVHSRNKTIFLDLKVSERGSNYLVITESRLTDEQQDQYERNTMVLFQDELRRFSESLTRMLLQFTNTDQGPSEEQIAEARQTYPRAYYSWTEEEDHDLRLLVESGSEMEEMVIHLQRAEGAVLRRIRRLKLSEAYPQTAKAA
ncbi:MAG: DUF3276 family protein [Bacteroidota bacterium]